MTIFPTRSLPITSYPSRTVGLALAVNSVSKETYKTTTNPVTRTKLIPLQDIPYSYNLSLLRRRIYPKNLLYDEHSHPCLWMSLGTPTARRRENSEHAEQVSRWMYRLICLFSGRHCQRAEQVKISTYALYFHWRLVQLLLPWLRRLRCGSDLSVALQSLKWRVLCITVTSVFDI